MGWLELEPETSHTEPISSCVGNEIMSTYSTELYFCGVVADVSIQQMACRSLQTNTRYVVACRPTPAFLLPSTKSTGGV